MTQRARSRIAVAGGLLAAGVLGAAGIFALARSRTIQLFGRLVPRVDTDERVVALTFDDGPKASRVQEVLTALADRGVHATFFVCGADLEAAPDSGRQLVAAGHELGNHTYSHARLVGRSQAFIRQELERTDALIRAAGEQGPIFFRPPYCWKLVGLPWFLSRADRTTITMDIEPDSYGDVRTSPERIVAHVRERVQPGSIILLHVWWGDEHSSGAACRAAVPMIIDTLRGDGYRFVTVGDLLRAKKRSNNRMQQTSATAEAADRPWGARS